MKQLIIYILLLLVAPLLYAQSGNDAILETEVKTFAEIEPVELAPTTSHPDSMPLTEKEINRLFWKPDPMRAVWLGAIVPGMGQIYNRSYWKLPIVYGGFMGCIYAISWTNGQYEGYKQAYRDIYYDIENGTVSDSPDKSYNAILPEGYTISSMGGASTYQSRLKEWQNTSLRQRDLSILVTIAVYALSLIDAYVDAQLFDFDISNDLSLNVSPQIYYDMQSQRTAEVKLAISF